MGRYHIYALGSSRVRENPSYKIISSLHLREAWQHRHHGWRPHERRKMLQEPHFQYKIGA